MNNNLWKWFAIVAMVVLFVTVVVTSVLLSQKRGDINKIPDIATQQVEIL